MPPGKKETRVFGWASFLNDLGSDMISPLWPTFVTSVLGAPVTFLGFIDGLGDAIVSLSQAVSGVISDRMRRRKVFIWIGYLAAGLGRLGYSLAATPGHLVLPKILDRSGKLRDAPRDAFLAEVTERESRGEAFGFVRAMDNFGAVTGILISLALIQFLDIPSIILFAAIPSLFAALLVMIGIREKRAEPDSRTFPKLAVLFANPNLRRFFFANLLFALGAFGFSFLLVAVERSGFPVVSLPIFYLLFTLTAGLGALPFGKLSDRIGRKKVLSIAFGLWALAALGFVLFGRLTEGRGVGVLFAGLLFILFGLHKAALEPSQRTFAAELAPPEERASTLGSLQFAVGLAAFPASFVAGILWDQLGMATAFGWAFGLAVAGMLMLLTVRESSY